MKQISTCQQFPSANHLAVLSGGFNGSSEFDNPAATPQPDQLATQPTRVSEAFKPGMAKHLPFQSQEGFMSSLAYADTYGKEHALPSNGLDSDDAAIVASARLQWFLTATRPELSGMFSAQEIICLMDCYQDELLAPHDLRDLAGKLCDHWGIEPIEDYVESHLKTVVDKLCSLTYAQQLTLGDALEQAWHRGSAKNVAPQEIFRQLGIELH